VYQTGSRCVARHMVVFAVAGPTHGSGASRLGVTATRKIGNAVVRARCKRRLRELFRLYFEETDRAVDLVINARKGCGEAPWLQLREDFQNCLEELRVRLASRSAPSPSTNDGSRRSCLRPAGSSPPARSTPPKPSPGMAS
jgi:ribonuclease P protein component